MPPEKLQSKLKKYQTFDEDKDLAIFEALDEIAEKLEPIGNVKIIEIKGDKGDTPTKDELLEIIKPLIPEPIPGKDGENGVDGRTPMFVGSSEPKNPQKGDLWYQI